MTTETETPKIDLSTGLVPRKKAAPPKVDLSGGLVAKRRGPASPADQPTGSELASETPFADVVPAAKRTEESRPLGTAGLPKTRQVAGESGAGARVEPPANPASIAAAPQAMRPAASVDKEMPAAAPAAPAARSRIPSTPLAGEAAGSEPLQPVREREPQAPPVSRPFVVREPLPEPVPPAPVAPAKNAFEPPGQSWERSSNRIDHVEPEAAPEEVNKPEPEETPYDAARRMSGLRNLILSLGLKSQNQLAEPVAREAEAPLPVEPPQQRLAYARPAAPIAETAARHDDAGTSTTLVTAPPEFLPPKSVVEKRETEHSRVNNGTSRRDRREPYDDVEILPSWRGQYKKKG